MATTSIAAKKSLAHYREQLNGDTDIKEIVDGVFYRKLFEQLILWSIGAVIVVYSPSLLLRGAGILLIGAVYARNLELVHECIHFTALKSRPLCRFWGIVLALPMLTNFEEWRSSHARHHVDVTEEGFVHDPSAGNLSRFLKNLLSIDHFRNAIVKSWLAMRHSGKQSTKSEKRIHQNFRLMAVVLLGAVAIDGFGGTALISWLWFLPLIPAAIINFHIQLPEHYGCTTASNDALLNSRTIKAGVFARWFVNGNNFHSSHHWIADIPVRHLKVINEGIFPFVQHTDSSYWSFYGRYYTNLVRSLRRRAAA